MRYQILMDFCYQNERKLGQVLEYGLREYQEQILIENYVILILTYLHVITPTYLLMTYT